MRNILSRRRVLAGLGAGVALSPFVPLLQAGGQEMIFPKRLILFYSPDGTGYSNWNPSGSGLSFTPGPIHEPLSPHKTDISILGGVRLTTGGAGEGHAYGMCGMWSASRCKEGSLFDGGNMHMTGWGSSATIDQVVARAYGPTKPYLLAPDAAVPETPYRTLELGVGTQYEHITSRMIYAGDDAPIAPDPSPYSVFDRLFGNVNGDEVQAERLRAARRSVLDQVRSELTEVKNHRAAAEERPKLDAHLEGIRSIEQRLSGPAHVCEVPVVGGQMNVVANENFPALLKLQMDLLVRALSCDLTRVVSLQASTSFSNVRHAWIGASEGHHGYSHNSQPEWNAKIDTWYATQFAYLLEQLKSVPEGNGTLLDNTLVVWGRDMALASGHQRDNAPLVVAGRAKGAHAPLGYIDHGGVGHHRLLVSICNAMGLDDVTSFGNLSDEQGSLNWG